MAKRVSRKTKAEALELLEEGISKAEIARRLGVGRSSVGAWARAIKVEVSLLPVKKLRLAVQSYCVGGETRGALCERIGWTYKETSKLARVLGEMPDQQKKTATTIREDLALKILGAIHLDPVDIGI